MKKTINITRPALSKILYLQMNITITNPIMIHIQHFHAFLECSSNFSASFSNEEKFLSDKWAEVVTIYLHDMQIQSHLN